MLLFKEIRLNDTHSSEIIQLRKIFNNLLLKETLLRNIVHRNETFYYYIVL